MDCSDHSSSIPAVGLGLAVGANPARRLRLHLFGNIHQFGVQVFIVIVTVAFAASMTFIIFKIVDALIGMRVEEKNEIVGLDLTQQSEAAYTVIE